MWPRGGGRCGRHGMKEVGGALLSQACAAHE